MRVLSLLVGAAALLADVELEVQAAGVSRSALLGAEESPERLKSVSSLYDLLPVEMRKKSPGSPGSKRPMHTLTVGDRECKEDVAFASVRALFGTEENFLASADFSKAKVNTTGFTGSRQLFVTDKAAADAAFRAMAQENFAPLPSHKSHVDYHESMYVMKGFATGRNFEQFYQWFQNSEWFKLTDPRFLEAYMDHMKRTAPGRYGGQPPQADAYPVAEGHGLPFAEEVVVPVCPDQIGPDHEIPLGPRTFCATPHPTCAEKNALEVDGMCCEFCLSCTDCTAAFAPAELAAVQALPPGRESYLVEYASACTFPDGEQWIVQSSAIHSPLIPGAENYVFDLKGYLGPSRKKAENLDVAFVNNKYPGLPFVLEPDQRNHILLALERDTKFLSKQHLIDYSLLLKVEVVSKQDLLNALVTKPETLLKLLGCDVLQTRAEDGHTKVYAYSFGIIDIFMNYNYVLPLRKLLGPQSLGARPLAWKPPPKYARRFMAFMRKHVFPQTAPSERAAVTTLSAQDLCEYLNPASALPEITTRCAAVVEAAQLQGVAGDTKQEHSTITDVGSD